MGYACMLSHEKQRPRLALTTPDGALEPGPSGGGTSPLTNDATARPAHREAALAERLAAIHDTWDTALRVLEADREAGSLPPHLVAEQMRLATAAYDRDRALAELTADTGWQTWVGVGGLLYAKQPSSSPAKVVRAATEQELRQAVGAAQDGEQSERGG